MPELRLSNQAREGCMVVAVHGGLDVVTSGRLDDSLSDARARSGRVILDLSGADFLDTTAVAVIVSHWRRQAEAGGTFLLAGARYAYTKALWITGLADRLPMYDDADTAVTAALAAPGA